MMRYCTTHHLCGLGAGYLKLEVGVFLPVSEEERELGEKAVVGVAGGCNSLGTGVAVQATLLRLEGCDQLLPVLELLWLRGLRYGQS